MGEIYTSRALGRTLVGTCEDGRIYRDLVLRRRLVGGYSNGNLYRSHILGHTLVGSYANGRIYSGSGRTLVGSYSRGGEVYAGRGLGRRLVGYSDEPAGAAALLLLLDGAGPLENSGSGDGMLRADFGCLPFEACSRLRQTRQ